MVVVVLGFSTRYLGRRTACLLSAGLFAWFLYLGSIGYFGVIRNITMRPPGPVFLFIPVVAFLLLFVVWARSAAGGRVASAFPLLILIGTQVFRVVVELFLHELWHAGLIPKMLTFAGANVDIYIGASAPVIAWFSTRARRGTSIALFWNLLGLLALANVVTRAVLTAPGPFNLIHAELSNLMIGTFPFMFIPGFFVPLAVVLHVLALRSISPERGPQGGGEQIQPRAERQRADPSA